MARIRFTSNAVGAREALMQRAKPQAQALATEMRDEVVIGMDPGPPRSGNEYRIPGTRATYTASAPGQPPAVREAAYRDSWKVGEPVVSGLTVSCDAYSDLMTEDGENALGDVLEHGTWDGRLAPRPHIRPAMETLAARYGLQLNGGDGDGS